MQTQRQKTRTRWLDRIAILSGTLLVAGVLGGWLRLLPAIVAFYLFGLGGIVSTGLAIIFLIRRFRQHALGFPGGFACVAAAAFIASATLGSGDAPPTNDFTTDLDDPPTFTNARTLADNLGRDLSYPAEYRVVQEQCCSDLRPQTFQEDPDQVLNALASVAAKMPGWTIIGVSSNRGTIEAVATSILFGFKDDIVIRVQPSELGSLVDVRSKSREGKSDLGANAARIRAFQNSARAELP